MHETRDKMFKEKLSKLSDMILDFYDETTNYVFILYTDGQLLSNKFILILFSIFIGYFIIKLYYFMYSRQYSDDLSINNFNAASAGEHAAVISIQGQRRYMEDTYQAIPNKLLNNNNININNNNNNYHLNGLNKKTRNDNNNIDKYVSYYGVFDGHGGARCSVYVAHYLHKHILQWINAYINYYNNNIDNKKHLINDLKKHYNNNSNSNNNNCDDIPICIEKIINQILFKSHKKADEEFLQLANRQRWKDGSTSVSCIILNINKFIKILINDKKYNTFIDRIAKPNDTCIFVANTGDSRCILVKNNGEIKEMSNDHKPNSESERHRITQNGGRVVFFGTWRVEGILAVSRSFGDRLLKRWIIPDCDIIKHKININKDLFLILATDGVWDTVSNIDAAKISINEWNNNNTLNNNNINKNNNDIKPTINKDNNNNNNNNNDLSKRLKNIAQKITSFAYSKGSMDNITTLIIHLPSHVV